MSVAVAFTSLKAAIDTLAKLRDLTKTLRNVELKEAIAKLSNDLADTQLEMAKLKQENAALREEVESLKNPKKAEPFTKHWGCYRFEGDSELYCPGCYANGKKSPTTRLDTHFRQCTVCRTKLGG